METKRETPIQIRPEEFKKIGYQLTDAIAGFIDHPVYYNFDVTDEDPTLN